MIIAKQRWTHAAGLTVAAAALAAGSLTAGTASAATMHADSWFAATVGASGVNVRDCYHPTTQLPPSTNCTYQTTLSAGTSIHVVCQRSGQNIGGDPVWDYITYSGGEGYVADYYINTGYSSWIPGIQICS
jgi:hypothetical protein